MPRPRRSPARFVWAALFTAAAAVGVLPDLSFGLDRRSPFVQIVSFRWQLLVAGLVLLIVLGVVTLLKARRAWPFTAGLAAVLLIGAGMVAPRVLPDPVPTTGTPFKVLSFNVYEGRADTKALADLIRTEQPDVVALPEAGQRFADKLAPLIEPMGYRLRSSVDEDEDDVNGVTAAVAARLGDVSFRVGHNTVDVPGRPDHRGHARRAARWSPFHSVAPVPGAVPEWRDDMALLPTWCAGPTPAIVAGDFNATLDHSLLRAGMAGCGDAAAQRGDGPRPDLGPDPTHPGDRPADRPRAGQPRHRGGDVPRCATCPAVTTTPSSPRCACPDRAAAVRVTTWGPAPRRSATAPTGRPRPLGRAPGRGLSGSPPRGRGPTRRTSAPGVR